MGIDALPADVLHQLIERAILQVLDVKKMKEIITKEESDKDVLTKIVDDIVQGKSGIP